MKVRLEVMSGAMDGEEFQLRSSFDIGREKSNQVALYTDKYVSRRHARVHIKGKEVILEDLRSTNGTFVNGEKVTGRTHLSSGKLFRVGRTWLMISW